MASAHAAGATVSLDTNWDPSGRWNAGGGLAAVLAQAGLLLPNEAEALQLSGETDLAAARTLTAGGARLVVELGARGALCAGGRERYRVSLSPAAPVDTTGAGDCFNAGLIAGLLGGLPLPWAAALGCAAGALSTRAPGGTGSCPDLPTATALAEHAAIGTAAAKRRGGDRLQLVADVLSHSGLTALGRAR